MTEQPATTPAPAGHVPEAESGRAWYFWPLMGVIAIVGVFVVGLIAALLIALLANPDHAAAWVGLIRDLFIIVLALEGMFMGLALIVLILQIAALVNLLQSEIKPIVDNASETVTTVRGTAQFMSQNVVEPVIKFGAITAAIGGILRESLGIQRILRSVRKTGETGKS
jgi:prepilin signal peptidase PulO-like enzyme (type II secretory pathway)